MKILALNPFHGGSHRAFLETWIRHSSHQFTTLTQPATRWKWRMRQSAVAFADECRAMYSDKPLPDVVFTTDMLNVAEFLGLCPKMADVPIVVYFHENQLTYPVDPHNKTTVDLQPAFSNFTSALAATEVWFNSDFHRQEYLAATVDYLSRMPDGKLSGHVERIRSKSIVQHPPVELLTTDCANTNLRASESAATHIVWVGRWEHDKRPDVFFEALRSLKSSGFDFRLSMLGESYAYKPDYFETARRDLADNIDHWGFQESRGDYEHILKTGDIVVSTAIHEFFGIAIVEAVSAGCCPVVPNALAYPEVLGPTLPAYHDGSVQSVADAIRECAASLVARRNASHETTQRFEASARSREMDERILMLLNR